MLGICQLCKQEKPHEKLKMIQKRYFIGRRGLWSNPILACETCRSKHKNWWRYYTKELERIDRE